MLKTFSHHFIITILAIVFVFMPKSIFAATLNFKVIPNTKVEDRTIVVEVRIDPQSKKLNVVEGVISFSGAGSNDLFVQIENGQSVLPIWPTPPKYNKEEKSINFTGGVPNGFEREGLLFRLRLSPGVSGDINISFVKGNAYLNDGKGTKEFIYSNSLTLNTDKLGLNKTKVVSYDQRYERASPESISSENSMTNTEDLTQEKSSSIISSFDKYKYVIIILLITGVTMIIFKYVFKKNEKK